MQQKERTETTDRILSYCEKTKGYWAFKVFGSAFQGKGFPDIIGCHEGRFFACECKQKNGSLSKIQKHVLWLISEAGGDAFSTYSFEEFIKHMEE